METRLAAGVSCVVAALFLAVMLGCSGSTAPKTATVKGTLKINGQPAKDVLVTFSPLEANVPAATGMVKDGTFELSTGVQGAKGAVPGKYKVVLAQQVAQDTASAAAAYGPDAKGPPPPPKPSFLDKYSQAQTSDKTVEVKPGSNDIVIEL